MKRSDLRELGLLPRRWIAEIQVEAQDASGVAADVWDGLRAAGIGATDEPMCRVDADPGSSVRVSNEVRAFVADETVALEAKAWWFYTSAARAPGRITVDIEFASSASVARAVVHSLAAAGLGLDFAVLSPEKLNAVRVIQAGIAPDWVGTAFRPASLSLPRRRPLSPGEHPRGPFWLGWSNVLSHDCFVESGAHDAWRAGRLPGEVRSLGGHHEWLVTPEPLDGGKVADIRALRRAYLCLPWLVVDEDGA